MRGFGLRQDDIQRSSYTRSRDDSEPRTNSEYDVLRTPQSQSVYSTTSFGTYRDSIISLPSGQLGTKVYQYEPLEDSTIRLLKVLPETMWKLKCEILHVSLEKAPRYRAISYAWGDGIDTKSLVLEGVTIPVAVNLHDALRAIRDRKNDIWVWVDALCIDQQNKEERSAQVRLMGNIYSKAESVDIWIGAEYENSTLATRLLQKLADKSSNLQHVSSFQEAETIALLRLFKRDYWERLWVVQEVLLANEKHVYCGKSRLPWEVYEKASNMLWDESSDPYVRRGPSSFPSRSTLVQLGDESLLEIMRACRKKRSENPRDKIFGVLGLLSQPTQHDFPVDYDQPVKAVYIDVVDHLISTTEKLDVIREAIHFPLHTNSMGLPTWCPDWSHIPDVSGLGRTFGFAASNSASGPTKAQYSFHDDRRKLEVAAIRIDVIKATGVPVGTFCAAQDYLTAFHQWRAMLLHFSSSDGQSKSSPVHEAFCRTLCLGQVPTRHKRTQAWSDVCYKVFGALIQERMPYLPIDKDLKRHANTLGLVPPDAWRKFLQDHFGNRMMGRTLCITDQGLIGMGSGYMVAGDIIVVPFGCSTPIILRPEDYGDEYRYIGDVYIDGYMHGEAVAELKAGDARRVVSKYMLC
ncbi:HET-domain-containing protein [Pyrenochaeta sp. DS3sAY3a]|nr:HET-domain-containing protein [Pyrenochaeta sp. DS3sAY3a]